MSASRIEYSEKYADDKNEYRYVDGVIRTTAFRARLVATLQLFGSQLTLGPLLTLQTCHSSQRAIQDSSQESPLD